MGSVIGGSMGAGTAEGIVTGAAGTTGTAGMVGRALGGSIGAGCWASAVEMESALSAQRVEWNLAMGSWALG